MTLGVGVSFLVGLKVAETEAVGDTEREGVGLPDKPVGVGVDVGVKVGVGLEA